MNLFDFSRFFVATLGLGLSLLMVGSCGGPRQTEKKPKEPDYEFSQFQAVRIRADGKRGIVCSVMWYTSAGRGDEQGFNVGDAAYDVRYATSEGYKIGRFKDGELEPWPNEVESPPVIRMEPE